MRREQTIRIKVLLLKLRTYIENETYLNSGMCWAARTMSMNGVFDQDELYLLLDYFDDHKPKEVLLYTSMYWWQPGLKEPRLEWLTTQIDYLDTLF